MKVNELINKLSKFDPEMKVLGEFDSDGDEFMIKLNKCKVYKGNGCDDSWDGEDNEDEKEYCILQFDFK